MGTVRNPPHPALVKARWSRLSLLTSPLWQSLRRQPLRHHRAAASLAAGASYNLASSANGAIAHAAELAAGASNDLAARPNHTSSCPLRASNELCARAERAACRGARASGGLSACADDATTHPTHLSS